MSGTVMAAATRELKKPTRSFKKPRRFAPDREPERCPVPGEKGTAVFEIRFDVNI
jgi:hypothetical protein